MSLHSLNYIHYTSQKYISLYRPKDMRGLRDSVLFVNNCLSAKVCCSQMVLGLMYSYPYQLSPGKAIDTGFCDRYHITVFLKYLIIFVCVCCICYGIHFLPKNC